jgi:putative aldouronate transport system permease protein
MVYKESLSRRLFVAANYIFCIVLALVCIAPMVHIFAVSLSGSAAVNAGRVGLVPVDFSLDSYKYILSTPAFPTAMMVSVKRVVLSVVISMTMTVLAAYPLSKSRHRFGARQFYVWYLLITMIISGGLIPTYLLISSLKLMDSIWALVLPGAVNVYNIILLQNYIKSLPDEILESAFVDGAGHWRTLVQIVLPLCKPVMATLVLFVAVGNWNAWFDGLIYMNRTENYPLQSYLQTIVVEIDMTLVQSIDSLTFNLTQKGNNAAQIFLAMLPIICIYPFLQRYFTKGIVLGSVKG